VGQVVAGTAQQDLAGTRTNHKVHQHRFTRHGIQSGNKNKKKILKPVESMHETDRDILDGRLADKNHQN